MSDDELKAMVDAFLAWPLPADVAADAIACKPGAPHRTGTNLLTSVQARAMFEHCLAVVRAHDEQDTDAVMAQMDKDHAAEVARLQSRVDALVRANVAATRRVAA